VVKIGGGLGSASFPCGAFVAADESAAKEAAVKARAAVPEAEAAKDAATREREGAVSHRAALSKESASRQTTLDRLRHERHDLLGRVQTSQLALPLKASAAAEPAAADSDKRGGRKKGSAGSRKAAAAAAADEDVEMFSQAAVGGTADALESGDAAEDADDRRVSRVDFGKLTLDTDDVRVLTV